MKVLIINGPNLNMLGTRERHVYGANSYQEMCTYLRDKAEEIDMEVDIVQSNHEGEIVEYIQKSSENYDGIIINPGAYTHYSIVICDALKATSVPVVEVHLSNIYSREEFRKKSITVEPCVGQICGFGAYGYVLGMLGLKQRCGLL
ncbi:MAG TPA: type II 3-dehydroquinate dehydratase [Thermoanaerobacterales bacterium]|nr:type II 3-dehydroquinate dehydratase [Thermoanaerobacterales bacterium]